MLRLHGGPGSSYSGCCRSPRSGSRAPPCRPERPARAATRTTEVNIVPSGYGDIRVEGAAASRPDLHQRTDEKDEKLGCRLSVPTGYDVDVQSDPQACGGLGGASSPAPTVQSEFRGWSRPECKAKGTADLHDQGQCRSGVGRRTVLARVARGSSERGGHGRRRRQPPDVRRSSASCHGPVQGRRTGDGDRPADHGGGDHPLGYRLRPLRERSRQRPLSRPHLGVRNFVSVSFDGFDPARARRSTRP